MLISPHPTQTPHAHMQYQDTPKNSTLARKFSGGGTHRAHRMLAIASTSSTEALPKAGDSNSALNTHTHTHTQIQQPMISNGDPNQVPNPHTHPYLNDTHAHHSKEIKVSPPSLDGKIAACDHHGNHVPPLLEISPAPEISQLGRRTCAEDLCDHTKEREKHNAAWASDDAVQSAVNTHTHTYTNPAAHDKQRRSKSGTQSTHTSIFE
jgi:hypothetical protein